jgi:hypothetical protein
MGKVKKHSNSTMQQTLALISSTSVGRSVGTVRSRTKATELVMHTLRPPLWSSGQSSWLQIQRPGFDSQRYQIF